MVCEPLALASMISSFDVGKPAQLLADVNRVAVPPASELSEVVYPQASVPAAENVVGDVFVPEKTGMV